MRESIDHGTFSDKVLAELLDDAEPATLIAQELEGEGIGPERLFQVVRDLERAGLLRRLWFDLRADGLAPSSPSTAVRNHRVPRRA